jgi:transcriptional regulator GlxA family with amidase domain
MSNPKIPFDPTSILRGLSVDRSDIQRMRKIGFLIYPDFEIVDLTGPLDAFYYAERALRTLGRESEPGYEILIIAASSGVVRSKSGLEVVATHSYKEITEGLDTLLIMGGEGAAEVSDDEALIDWIKAVAVRARRVAAICTGAFLLARAGLLTNRKATTHWMYCDQLAAAYPQLTVEPNRIFVRDGAVYTSGGITAGIDLALALIEEDLGREVPRLVAATMVVFLRRPGGQAQFTPFLQGETTNCRDIAELKSWILGNAHENLTVEVLARKISMSPRNFARRFRAETGMTPARFVDYARVEAARCRLEQTRLPLESVAGLCGFASLEGMRRSFKRYLDIGPREYRDRFQSTVANGYFPPMTGAHHEDPLPNHGA